MTNLEAVAKATENRAKAQEEWEESLRLAARSHSLRTIAPAAGVTYARVSQIVGRKS